MLFVSGCSTKQNEGVMKIPHLGFAMKLPSGWQQGRMTNNEQIFVPKTGGMYCFESGVKKYPYGTVIEIPGPGSMSLSDYAKAMVAGRLVDETVYNNTINGYETVTVIEEDYDRFEPQEQTPITVIHTYILRNNKVIWISFWALREDYTKYERSFRQSINSIEIDNT